MNIVEVLFHRGLQGKGNFARLGGCNLDGIEPRQLMAIESNDSLLSLFDASKGPSLGGEDLHSDLQVVLSEKGTSDLLV